MDGIPRPRAPEGDIQKNRLTMKFMPMVVTARKSSLRRRLGIPRTNPTARNQDNQRVQSEGEGRPGGQKNRSIGANAEKGGVPGEIWPAKPTMTLRPQATMAYGDKGGMVME